MTRLDQAATDFFREVMVTGGEVLGHMNFAFKFDALIGVNPQDAEHAKLINARIQRALDVAKASVTPNVPAAGVSVQ